MNVAYEENILIKNEPEIDADSEFPESHFDVLETPHMQFLDPIKQLQFFREAGLTDAPELCDKTFKCNVCGKAFKRKSHLTRHQILHTGQKPFACQLCDERFTRSENRARHVMQVHQTGAQHECTICHKQFGKLHTMERHMKLHEVNRPHGCDTCGNRYTRAHKLALHKLTHTMPPVNDTDARKFACDICFKRFTRKDHMQRHRVAHAGVKLHECAFCSKRFSRKDNQVKHQNSCTIDSKGGGSNIMNHSKPVVATRKKELLESEFITVDTLPTSFVDVPCDSNDDSNTKHRASSRLRSKPNHMPSSKDGAVEIFLVQNSEQDDQLHLPQGLGDPFGYEQESHIEQVSDPLAVKDPLPINIPKLNIDVHGLKCNVCAKKFRHKHHLLRHQYVHLGIKPFKCPECDREFSRKEHLNRHIAVHEKQAIKVEPSNLNALQQMPTNATSLSMISDANQPIDHIDAEHFFSYNFVAKTENCSYDEDMDENSGNYVSSLLEISMSSTTPITPISRLDTKNDPDNNGPIVDWAAGNNYTEMAVPHKSSTNDDNNGTDDKRFPCDKCNKIFHKQFLLTRHYTLHTGEKRFKCEICGRGFTRMEHQKRHMTTHSNAKQHECDLCDRKFNRTDHLLAHMKSAHAGIKPYRCPNKCGARFHSFREKAIHMQQRECVNYCDICNTTFETKCELDYHQQTHEQISLETLECPNAK